MNQMLTAVGTEESVAELAAGLDGDVVAPADSSWDLARRAWKLTVDQQPALVAVPADAADVVVIVDFARANGG